MGKAALLLVVTAFSVLGVSYLTSSREATRAGEIRQIESESAALARNAAITGLMRAKQDMIDRFVTDTLAGSLDGVTYQAVITVTDPQARVVATGFTTGPQGEAVSREVSALYERLDTEALPEFAAQAVVVDDWINFGGNSDVVTIGVTDGSVTDARIHTNGRLSSNGSAGVIGFGSYTNEFDNITDVYRPTENPDNLPLVIQRDSIHIPPVNPVDVIATYGGADFVYVTDQTFRDVTLAGGTRDNPLVYQVTGVNRRGDPNRLIFDNVTVNGYAIFLSPGNILVDGYLRSVGSQAAGHGGPQESTISLFGQGHLYANGASVEAQVYVDGDYVPRSGSEIVGSLTLGGKFSTGGGAYVRYVPASPALNLTWSTAGVGSGWRVLSYAE